MRKFFRIRNKFRIYYTRYRRKNQEIDVKKQVFFQKMKGVTVNPAYRRSTDNRRPRNTGGAFGRGLSRKGP